MCSRFDFTMTGYLYIYDCRQARRSNARRVSFTKELYGYTYSWKTKSGIKEKRKPGLLEECGGSRFVADSTVYVPDEYRSLFDSLFEEYQDILTLKIFEVVREIQIDFYMEHVF